LTQPQEKYWISPLQNQKKNRAILAQLTVELSQDGKVYLENQTLDPKLFRQAMDEWNDTYEGTLTLTNLLYGLKREIELLQDKIPTFLK
jgi:hypothetical protein